MNDPALKGLRPRLKVWLEFNGRPVFGDGKLRWLQLIDQTGSLRETARALGMSYRGLWGRLRGMEERLGRAVVVRQIGGAGGGGVQLTDLGRALVRAYPRFRNGIDDIVGGRFVKFLALVKSAQQRARGRHSKSKPGSLKGRRSPRRR